MSRILTAAALRNRPPLPTLRNRAVRLAASMPQGHPYRRRLLMFASGKAKRVAGGWEDTALAELAEDQDLDVDSLKTHRGAGRNSINVESRGRGSSGESEWMLFKDGRSAESYALEYVTEMLEDDAGMFDAGFIKSHLTISKTDARMIAIEEADNYIEGVRDEDEGERVTEEADMEDAWNTIAEAMEDLENVYPEPDDYEKQLKALETKREALVDKAAEKVSETYSDDLEKRINDDAVGWYEEMGFGKLDRSNLPDYFILDTEAAAKAAIRDDGIAVYLDHYDGDAIELSSGAVAYGTN
jgi:hypothetical protein